MCKRFPILLQYYGDEKQKLMGVLKDYPKSVPWEMVEAHRKQIESNHSQSLEQLAERGGLSPGEMLAAFLDTNVFQLQLSEAEMLSSFRDTYLKEENHVS